MKKLYNVTNRSAGIVVYSIPEIGVRREFAANETKKIELDELRKLAYQPGGKTLIEGFLRVVEDEVVDQLGLDVQDEYYMTEDDVKKLILEGTAEEFLDCLDYAPIGIIDLIKNYAVSLPMADMSKIKALKEKTGFDVMAAIKNIQAEVEEDETEAPKTTARRSQSKYKIKSSEEEK